jgi:predicted amidohydrolase
MKFILALAQIDPVLGDLRRNVTKHVEAAEKAIERGAGMVVFPELSLTGYTVRDMNWDLAVNTSRVPGDLQPLLNLSARIPIIAGGIEEGEDFKLHNSAFLFENGRIISAHRKTYPPTYGMFEEMRYFSRGETVHAIDTVVGRIGVLVCEDLWHISLPYLLALDGAQLVVALVASPTRIGGNEKQLEAATINAENHKAYARLLSVYIAFCNRVGYEDGVSFWGGSSIVAPDGDIMTSAKLFEEDLVCATIDEHEVRRARRFSRHFLDEDPRLVVHELSRILASRTGHRTRS